MDRYILGERIGNGSYSEVFRAVDASNNQPCAVKVMKYAYDLGRKAQDSEVQSLRKFSEVPTIINLRDCIISDSGFMSLVFDLLDTNLIDYYKMIKAEFNRNLDQREIKGIIYQVCLALAALHQQGFSHRDIKPENVLLKLNRGTTVPSVKLVDFGLTKKLDPLFNTQYIATRWYRSPEILLNMPYTQNNDVFALGCLIVELYLGFEAFQGNDTIDQLNKIFAVLGTPTEENWYQGARVIREKQIKFPDYDPIDLAVNIPGASSAAIDLINKVLEINPKRRIGISDVLAHPYFNDVQTDLPQDVLNYDAKLKRSRNKTDTAATGVVSGGEQRTGSQRQFHLQGMMPFSSKNSSAKESPKNSIANNLQLQHHNYINDHLLNSNLLKPTDKLIPSLNLNMSESIVLPNQNNNHVDYYESARSYRPPMLNIHSNTDRSARMEQNIQPRNASTQIINDPRNRPAFSSERPAGPTVIPSRNNIQSNYSSMLCHPPKQQILNQQLQVPLFQTPRTTTTNMISPRNDKNNIDHLFAKQQHQPQKQFNAMTSSIPTRPVSTYVGNNQYYQTQRIGTVHRSIATNNLKLDGSRAQLYQGKLINNVPAISAVHLNRAKLDLNKSLTTLQPPQRTNRVESLQYHNTQNIQSSMQLLQPVGLIPRAEEESRKIEPISTQLQFKNPYTNHQIMAKEIGPKKKIVVTTQPIKLKQKGQLCCCQAICEKQYEREIVVGNRKPYKQV